jgi:hypothetical protein
MSSTGLICHLYQQRRAWVTCCGLWPKINVTRAFSPLTLDDYVASIGDLDRVITMLIGDAQSIWVYAGQGYAIPQEVPENVNAGHHRLGRRWR